MDKLGITEWNALSLLMSVRAWLYERQEADTVMLLLAVM